MSEWPKTIDCAVIGGGPAGLSAAIYLARYLRTVTVFDAGESRARWIPASHNLPGFPEGISGTSLLQKMELQAGRFGAGLCKEKVISVERRGENFLLTTQNCSLIARSILMATGVVNNRPPMSDRAHSDALQRGLLRYCPVCDGFEAKNMKIAVIGCDGHGVSEALFLRRYSSSVTLLTLQRPNISECDQRELEETGVTVVFAPISDIAFEERTIAITTDLNPNVSLRFDTLYPALAFPQKSGPY